MAMNMTAMERRSQGGATPIEGEPAPQAAAPGEKAPGENPEVLANEILDSMSNLQQMLSQMDPEKAQALSPVMEAYVQALQGGGQPQAPQQGQSGPVPTAM
jgi:hypothetical protein